jgi:glycosyltransferase involved in cell wall biosynthesis
MNLDRDHVVLLFYQDIERDSFFPNDRYVKRLIRPIYHRFGKRQKVSGFLVWFQLLAKALRQQGYTVRVNDYAFAHKHPTYPVGLVGYPQLLERWTLPNPAIIGPGFFDHPKNAPTLMDDSRFHFYIVTCDWMERMFKPFYGDRCVQWHAGMDVEAWSDTKGQSKSIDVLVYDKIRWNRERYEPELLDPILQALDRRGLRHQTVRYGAYDHATYKTLLEQSRSMLFLCEHETQGMAYQEALASNVPVLAWDNGFWLDPRRPEWEPEPVPASSVPYFSAECGERFSTIAEFKHTLDTFWQRLHSYEPRRYVERELSFARSAELYMSYYRQLAEVYV